MSSSGSSKKTGAKADPITLGFDAKLLRKYTCISTKLLVTKIDHHDYTPTSYNGSELSSASGGAMV